jgi:hypothetical protein
MTRRNSWLLALALATPLVVGCAEERAPINRVQANALDKQFFVGELQSSADDPEFYWRNFVVDGSEAQSLVGIGSWSGVDRIRWDVQEHLLVARKSYSVSPGADDKGDAGSPDGTIVAAYPIDAHFDILRDYNPQTGEELNVIGENTSDRPWYERRYMRVDWSINLVETPMWFDMFFGKIFGDIKVTPLAYFVGEPDHPNAPHFDAEGGYFDVTSKFWVEPEQLYAPYTPSGSIPACILVGAYTGSAVDSCDPQEAVVRSSYLKVSEIDRDGDFEPLENSKAALDIVGNPGGLGASPWVGLVTPARIGWDPQYGYTDAGLKRYMHVHNIWQKSHQTGAACKADADCGGSGACLPSGVCSIACNYEARGDGDGNGTDDQCENSRTGYAGKEGSQCSARNRCTVPYRDREIRTVGYWVNQETPEALLDEVDQGGNFVSRGPSEDLVYSWNQALRLAVANAREVECRRTGGARAECHGEFFEQAENGVDEVEMVSYGGWGIPKVKPGKDVLVLCHNPVRSYDDPTCGEVGYSARIGDIRHNFMFYWPYASRAPWGGIGNWSADPLTGQIIGASATTMGRSATMSAAMARDIMMVANSELEFSDIVQGQTATKYQKQLRDGREPEVFTQADIDRQLSAIDAKHAASLLTPTTETLEPTVAFERQLRQQVSRVAVVGQATPLQQKFETLAKAVSSTPAAADLVNPNWAVDLFALSPSALGNDSNGLLSPLQGADPGKVEDYRKVIDQRLSMRGVCFADHQTAGNVGNPDMQSVARYYKEKYNDDMVRELLDSEGAGSDAAAISKKRADLIYEHLWKEAYKGIQLHELGHSLGLLHQFASSYDSPNYNPQYWQLRTNEGQSTPSCNGAPRGADDTCMGPRYLDPETDDELGRGAESRPGINYYAHTSTMEYQNERFFESVGLGQYDTFAMGALYGRVLETFDERMMPVASQNAFGVRSWSQLSEDNLIVEKVRTLFGVQDRVSSVHYTEQARRMNVFDPGRCRPATDEEKAQAEWRIVHGKVCAAPPKDHAHWDDFESGQAVPDDDPSSWQAVKWHLAPGAPGMTPGSVRWPYRYGTSDNAYIHTNPSDSGADVYETTVETIRKFDYSYPFSYFRRQRRDFFYPTLPGQTAYRFFERLRSVHWQVASTNALLQSFNAYDVAAADDNWHRPYVMAETKIFDTLTRALLMPQAGPYNTPLTMIDSSRPLLDTDPGATSETEFTLDTSTARYVDPDYDSSPSGGGSWEYLDWIDHTGFTFEKSLAALALADGRPNLMTISRENYLDGRDPYINFRSDMPQAVDRLLGGLLSSDWESIAPHVTAGGQNPSVEMLDLKVAEPSRPANSTLLFPNVGYRQQVGALVFAHIFARLNTDLTLANKLRIWVSGLSGELNIPEAQQQRFYNPESGITYIARRYGDDVIDSKTVDQGIGSRMLAHANALLAGSASRPGPYQVERDEDGNAVLDEFGQAVLVLDADGAAIAAENSPLLGEYRKYVGLLDAAVQIARAVGYGPFNGLPGGTDDN